MGSTAGRPCRFDPPVETLQRRYAEEEVGDIEFQRRLDALLESDGRLSKNATTTETPETTRRKPSLAVTG